jgi:hypothetical protein
MIPREPAQLEASPARLALPYPLRHGSSDAIWVIFLEFVCARAELHDLAVSEQGGKRVEVADVIPEAVGNGWLVGLAEPDEVGRDAVRNAGDVRNDVAPDV